MIYSPLVDFAEAITNNKFMASKKAKDRKPLIITLLLIIILPILGFYVGLSYEKNQNTSPEMEANLAVNNEEAEEKYRQSLKKCGDIPNQIKQIDGQFVQIGRAEWSNDCKYLAYNVEFSTLGEVTEEQMKKIGIYLYSKDKGTIEHVILNAYNSPSFLRWDGNNKIVFTYLGDPQTQLGNYTLSTKNVEGAPNVSNIYGKEK